MDGQEEVGKAIWWGKQHEQGSKGRIRELQSKPKGSMLGNTWEVSKIAWGLEPDH